MQILFAWLGNNDLKAAEAADASQAAGINELGPIGQVLANRRFDELHLLCNYDPARADRYLAWVRSNSVFKHLPSIKLHPIKLSSPTAHREIYDAALATCQQVIASRACDVTFHLKPLALQPCTLCGS